MSNMIDELTEKIGRSLAEQSKMMVHCWEANSAQGRAMTNAVLVEVLPYLLDGRTRDDLLRQEEQSRDCLDKLKILLVTHQLAITRVVKQSEPGPVGQSPTTCRFCGQAVTTVGLPDERSFLLLVMEHLRTCAAKRGAS